MHYKRVALGAVLAVPVLFMATAAFTAHRLHDGIGPAPSLSWLAIACITVGLALEVTIVILGMVSLGRGSPVRVVGTLHLLVTAIGFTLAAILTLLSGVWWLFSFLICSLEWGAYQGHLWPPFLRCALWGLVMLTYALRGLGWSILTWRNGPNASESGPPIQFSPH